MRRIARAFAAASIVLLGAAAVQAAELDGPSFQAQADPIEPGILDSILCRLIIVRCSPPELPPDPCVENPELCAEPDPCALDPELCAPHPIDPCELDPTLCEAEQPPIAAKPPPLGHSLVGNLLVRADGAKLASALNATLSYDTTARTFLLMHSSGAVYTGNLAPRGNKGRKFVLFLDDASNDAFSSYVAKEGFVASERPAGTVLGDSTRLVLKLDEEGAVSLKIRSEVHTSGLGAVVFKATLTAPAESL